VNTKSEPSHIANDIMGEVKEHVFKASCLVRMSLIFFLNSTIDSAISFRTFRTILWLAKTSNNLFETN